MARLQKQKSGLWHNFFLLPAIVLGLALFVINTTTSKPFCANSISCIKDLSGNFDVNAKTGVYEGKKIAVPAPVADSQTRSKVLGTSSPNDKRIEVNLTTQTLTAFQNNQTVMSFPISSGKWHPTPTGIFHIWIKLRYTRMVGGDPAYHDYYNLPNVPFVMFFSNAQVSASQGFSLHGTYWHNNFGHPMSHGCVNISIPNAQRLYDWADPPTQGSVTRTTSQNPGTEIIIYGAPPANEVSYRRG